MSAAAYSGETHWDIPVAVWPGVLGVSIVLHVCLLFFGVPGLPLTADPPEIVPETEVILETGAPVFQEAELLSPPPADLAATAPAEVSESLAPQTLSVIPVEGPEPAPVEAVRPEIVPAETVTAEAVPVLSETSPVQADIVTAQQLDPVPADQAMPAPVQTMEALPVATTIEAEPADQVPSGEIVALEELPGQVLLPETALVDQLPEAELVVPVPQIEADVPLLNGAGEEIPVLPEAPVETVVPLQQRLTAVPEVVNAPLPVTPDQQLAGAPILPEVTASPVPQAAAPTLPADEVRPLPPVAVLAEDSPQVVIPADTLTLAPIVTPQIETLAPTDLQVAEVEQAETELAALSPAEPDTSAVPSVAPSTSPADIVPPVEIATVDPLASVTGYVENYEIGACAHLSVLSAGADSAEVSAFGRWQDPFFLFDRRFTADQGFEASIRLTQVSENQCPLLNALGLFQGVEAAGLVELDRTVVRSGAPVSGLIHRDLPVQRIAAAQETGLDLSGRGPPELYLVDDAGQVHDGRDFLLPASSSATAGAWRFKVPVVKMSAGESETALVLAIWNRPASRQPNRFGTLPASRTDTILSAPGVYSLAAFKVSR